MFGEPLHKKLERMARMAQQYPELEFATPDQVMEVDNYRINNGGFVSSFSQKAMQLAAYAAEEKRRKEEEELRKLEQPVENQGYSPIEAPERGDGGFLGGLGDIARKAGEVVGDTAGGIAGILNPKVGVPGVGGRANSVNVNIGETADRPLGTLQGYAMRPGFERSSWMSAAAGYKNPGDFSYANTGLLQMLPESDLTADFGIGGESVGARLGLSSRDIASGALDITTDPTNLIPGIGVTGHLDETLRGIRGGARAYRDITRGIPVGASVRDISGGLPDDLAGGAAPSFADALDGLRNAVRTEARLRNTGQAAAEIRAGRSGQFGNVRRSLEQAMESGLSGEELANQARSGAAVGGLRRTVAEPVQLTQAQRDALFDEVMTRVADPKQDAGLYLTTTRALQKALDGEGLQPHEIRALQPLLGGDLLTALVDRAPNVADRLPAIESTRPRGGGSGPRLPGRTRLPNQLEDVPTPSRGRQAKPEQMGALTRRNIAEEEAERRAERLAMQESLRRTAPDLLAPTRPSSPTEFPTSGTGIPAGSTPRKADDLLRDPQAEQHRVSAIREGLKAHEKEALRQVGPSEEVLMERVRQLLSTEKRTLDLPGSPQVDALKPEVEATIEQWLKGNRDLLDNMGVEGSQLIANIGAQITGNVADSYLTAALSRRNILAEAMRVTWGDVADDAAAIQRDKLITRATEALFQRELKIRYPQGVPERITELLKTTRPIPYNESLGAISTFNQRAKNTMFGPLDIGVFGIQGLNAIRRGGIPLFAGMLNRTLAVLHMPNIATTYADSMLPKQVQFGLDGVKQGAVSGVFSRKQGNQEVGSLFQYLGPLGRLADRPFMAVADRLSQFQFGTVMGGIRNAVYEGDLVMAHMLGQDVTSAAVRADAAKNANAIGSFMDNALRRSRAQKEGVGLLSAPMTRARISQIKQMANVIGPKASPTERILGASMIISSVGYTLMAGKVLNDYVGIGDFEFIPGKPGFGKITTATGLVIDVIPQDSVENAFAKSIAAILQEDPGTAAEAWANLFIGQAGPAPQIVAGAFGVGYEPGRGYRYGDLGEGQGLTGRVMNLAPIPPLAEHLATEGFSPLATGLEQVGIGTYEESAYAQAARVYEQETGKDWKKATKREENAFKEKHPDIAAALEQDQVEQGGPEGAVAELRIKFRAAQEDDDERVQAGLMQWDEWKDNRTHRVDQLIGASAIAYGDERIKNPKDAFERWLNEARAIRGDDGVTSPEEWDRLDAWVAKQSPEDQQRIADETGQSGTKLEKDRRAVAAKLDDAGYFDLGDKVWGKIGKAAKSDAKSAEEYERQLRQKIGDTLRQRGLTPQQITILSDRAMENHGLLSRYKEIRNDLEQGFIIKNRELVADAFQLGFFQGSLRGVEEAAIMSASR